MSFILILIAVMVVYMMVSYNKKNNMTRRLKHNSRKMTKWILSGYAIILLLTVIFYYTLPNINAFGEVYNLDEFNQANDAQQEIYQAVQKGNINQVIDKYPNDQYEFTLTDRQFRLDTPNGFENIMFFVERMDTTNEKATVVYFKNKLIVDGIDMTDQIGTLEVEQDGNSIKISQPDTVELNLVKFSKEFTITQFTDEKERNEQMGFSGGFNIIYIQIPKDVEITNEDLVQIQFVGE
jgi:heme/copper-type cytochrome/quinol oxidase subunit 2